MKAKLKKKKPELPFVSMNMAMTADGKIATANRTISSFSSARDIRHLYELRAKSDAVMCGARTVEMSGAIMGTGGAKFRRQRLKNGIAERHLRVIVSGNGSMDPNALIFKRGQSPIIILTTQRASAQKIKQLQKLAAEVKICGKKTVNLRAALHWLRKKWQVKHLLCEGGGELNDALFRADLVDEINLTICPKIFGGRDAPTISDGQGFAKLAMMRQYHFSSVRKVKAELFTVLLKDKMGSSA